MFHKRSSFAVFALLLYGNLIAQVSEVGVKGGPAFTDLASSTMESRSILSMVAGVYAPIPINPRLIFQPELEIATMGASPRLNGEQVDVLRTAYLRAPMTLRWKVAPKLQVAVGLQPGYLLGAWRKKEHITEAAKEDVKPFDMALICGLSVRASRRTDITFRYVYGMSAVLAEDNVYYPANRAMQLTLGLRMKRFKGASEYRRRSHRS
jgi:hypothetical protein